MGQTDSVFVQYLIARGTADDIMWPLIQKKLDILGSCKLSADSYRVCFVYLLKLLRLVLPYVIMYLHFLI